MSISHVRIPVAEPNSAVPAGTPRLGDAVWVVWMGRAVCRILAISKEPANCGTRVRNRGGIDRITPAGTEQDFRVRRSAVGSMTGAP